MAQHWISHSSFAFYSWLPYHQILALDPAPAHSLRGSPLVLFAFHNSRGRETGKEERVAFDSNLPILLQSNFYHTPIEYEFKISILAMDCISELRDQLEGTGAEVIGPGSKKYTESIRPWSDTCEMEPVSPGYLVNPPLPVLPTGISA